MVPRPCPKARASHVGGGAAAARAALASRECLSRTRGACVGFLAGRGVLAEEGYRRGVLAVASWPWRVCAVLYSIPGAPMFSIRGSSQTETGLQKSL